MGTLRFKNAEKLHLIFGTGTLLFLRQEPTSVDISINYQNGSGQVLSQGQVLLEIGTPGTDGFLKITNKNESTFLGNGTFEINVSHQSTASQSNQVVSFLIDGSVIDINFQYNSKPIPNDVVINNPNRNTHTFKPTDFSFSDFDGDSISAIAIFGNVDGYEFDGYAYVEGTWITSNDLYADLFDYISLDQDAAYDKINTFKIKDSSDTISTTVANLEIKTAGVICVTPILQVATNSGYENFFLQWSYNGALYDGIPTNITIQYSIDGGVTFNDYTQLYSYPNTSANITIAELSWGIIHFRIILSNINCVRTSNEIIIDIT